MNKIICANAAAGLRQIPDGSVSVCVTSPPYYGLRDYGMDGQIGIEKTPEEYIGRLVEVFREVKRALREDGTLWVNIADSYAGNVNSCVKNLCTKKSKRWNGIKPKDMIGIPWMLAFALREDGWYLRSDIIWQKLNCMPENVKDRPTKSYEHIFLLSKSAKYYYDAEAIAEPLQLCSIERYRGGRSDHIKYKGFNGNQAIYEAKERGQICEKQTRNKRDVWSVSTNSYRMNNHFAMYPERLITPCILAGSPIGGVVLDPFFGSGTTGAAAKRLGREYIGIDLNPDYCRLAKERIDKVSAYTGKETEI